MASLRFSLLALFWCCLFAAIAADRPARASPALPEPVVAVVATIGSQGGGQDLVPQNAEVVLHERGLDVTQWRGIVMGAAPTTTSLRETLAATLPPDERRLVFHPRVDRHTVPEEMPVLLEAVRVLYRGEKDERAARAVHQALCWIVGNQLDEALWQLAGARSGHGQWRLEPPRPSRPGDREDPCKVHLALLFERPPAAGEEGSQLGPFHLIFHGPELDTIARGMAEQRAALGREEFTRRVVQATRKQQPPFLDDARASTATRLALRGVPIAEAAKRIAAEASLPLEIASVPAQPLVTVVSEGATAGDLLLALARIGRLTLNHVDEGYLLTPPRTTAERLWSALPLPLWGLARATPTERQIAREATIRELWPLLPGATLGTLRSLPEAARARVARLVEIGFAAAFRMQMADLPDATGTAHLALYESETTGNFMLGTPGASETIGGAAYLQLKTELTGLPWIAMPAKGEGK